MLLINLAYEIDNSPRWLAQIRQVTTLRQTSKGETRCLEKPSTISFPRVIDSVYFFSSRDTLSLNSNLQTLGDVKDILHWRLGHIRSS